MSKEIKMPKLGLTMTEGTVTEWFKAVGDSVEKGEALFSVTTDKLTNDVAATDSGVLLEILVQADEDAVVGAVVALLGEADEQSAPAPAEADSAAEIEVKMPKLGLTMTEGVISEWFKTEGDSVEKGEALFSVTTDKLTNDVAAMDSGVLKKILVQADEEAAVGAPVAILSAGGAPAAAKPKAETKPADGKTHVLVIGGGPGGYVAAIRAAQLGAKVTIVEKDRFGGTCLNRGCIPTKTLMHSAEVYEAATKSQEIGIVGEAVRVDWPQVQARRAAVSEQLVNGVQGLLASGKVTSVIGTAAFSGGKTVTVTAPDGSKSEITADKIILATGGKSVIPPIPGLRESAAMLDSTGALTLDHIPASLLVIGGGVIGLELGTVYHRFGTKVTVVEMTDRLLPMMDKELTNMLRKNLEAGGLEILTSAEVKKVEDAEGKAVITISHNGEEKTVRAEKILVAAGRHADLEPLQLSAAGVTAENGVIPVDDRMETAVPGIYAVGDCNGRMQLAHAAMAMGEVAAENAMGQSAVFDPLTNPSLAFVGPEFAGVGMTEEEAKESGIPYKVGRFPTMANGKSLISGHADGMVKVIAGKEYGQILGVHILADRASDLIEEAALALKLEATTDELIGTIHGHPTISESLHEAVLAAEKRAIHMPNR